MSFPPPPPGNILQAMALMGSGMTPQQYQMTPMGGLIQMPMGMAPPPHMVQSMGVTVPSGVTTISAPPIRKLTTDMPQQQTQPSLLGVYPGANPMFGQMNHDQSQNYRKPRPPPGSTITVFVGNITERASDMLIRQLLSKCGAVNNWKRVQGANGKLQAFGFCEYCDPESAMRALRLLNEYEIADKKLVVKVDQKTQEKLDEYKKSKGMIGDHLDEQTKQEDAIVNGQLFAVLKEHEIELSKDPINTERIRRFHNDKRDPNKPENLSEMEMEDDKRSLIHREIDKFRDTYKKYEEKKEEEKKRKEELEKERGDKNDDVRTQNRARDRSVDRERSKTRSLRNREPRSPDNRDKRKDRDRERERERERDRDRDWNRYNEKRDPPNDRGTAAEEEEEAYERRRVERQMREKESSYQRRLREWELREGRKSKDYDRERIKEENKKIEEEQESRRLKEFLEDYDDDRFDLKYYKGNSLTRRMRDRQKEIEADDSEREQERRELDELKDKLAEEGHPDPESEARKRMLSGDNDKERNAKIVNDKIRALMLEARQRSGSGARFDDDTSRMSADGSPHEEVHVKSFGFAGMKLSASGDKQQQQHQSQTSINNSPESANGMGPNSGGGDIKRKKLSVSEVFNANDDDDAASKAKKRKLPTLLDDNTDSNLSTGSNPRNVDAKPGMSSEEKRKQIKAIIESIPTSKDELFTYEIDWSLVDNTLMERRIRPWINKKIAEYIGEEEQALLDFICTKLQSKSSAQSILDDVAMVLDDEAEVFVVKMWRLLIYEIEAKKLGIGK